MNEGRITSIARPQVAETARPVRLAAVHEGVIKTLAIANSGFQERRTAPGERAVPPDPSRIDRLVDVRDLHPGQPRTMKRNRRGCRRGSCRRCACSLLPIPIALASESSQVPPDLVRDQSLNGNGIRTRTSREQGRFPPIHPNQGLIQDDPTTSNGFVEPPTAGLALPCLHADPRGPHIPADWAEPATRGPELSKADGRIPSEMFTGMFQCRNVSQSGQTCHKTGNLKTTRSAKTLKPICPLRTSGSRRKIVTWLNFSGRTPRVYR